MSLILFDAFSGVVPVTVDVTGTASPQTSAIVATVTPPVVTVSIAGLASAQVTAIRTGYPHHVAPSSRLFVWKV